MIDEIQNLRVWHNPQVGSGCPTLYEEVSTIREGVKVMNLLARYDAFQFDNRIKPDYSNAQGLQMLEDGEWVDWEYDDDSLGYYDDPEDYIETYDMLEEGC